MALEVVTGWTDDGLVFLKMEGQQHQNGRPIQTIVTVEPDQALGIAKRMVEAAEMASKNAPKKVLQVGAPITIPRR